VVELRKAVEETKKIKRNYWYGHDSNVYWTTQKGVYILPWKTDQ
jgi:hypothetical protein